MATLTLLIAGRDPKRIPLNGGRLRLGRSEECEIQVDQDGVSRLHAVVFRAGTEFVIEDLGSRNGTFVNGVRVDRQQLAAGDRIRLAPNAELEFTAERDGGAPPSRAPSRRPLHTSRYRLIAQDPPGGGRAIPIRSRVTTLGREGAAQITIADASVSMLHARLDQGPDGLYVTDLKSRNGTRVNGSPALRTRLQDGDLIQFGSVAFQVEARDVLNWKLLGRFGGTAMVLAVLAFGAFKLIGQIAEGAAVAQEKQRVRRQAVTSVARGIAAFRDGDVDFAKSYLSYAADILAFADLAPEGTSLRRPNELFRVITPDLPPADRSFDFGKVFDSSALDSEKQRAIERLSNQDYVKYQCELIAVELGQSRDVPPGFLDQVRGSIDGMVRADFQTILDRSRLVHPRLIQILHQASLPEIFCYVAWIESGLSSTARSPAGAVGLWQFMPSTARQYGLRVEPGLDERVDVAKSTRAAAGYIGNLIRKFGREQFMCALASYNRGEFGVWNAMERIQDPMMESSKKYWYLVENQLLPRETSEYVSRIFAARILAGAPERFGLRPA